MRVQVRVTIQTNDKTKLSGAYPVAAVDKLLSFKPEGHQWSPAFKRGIWDGYIRLFKAGLEILPTGCLPIVLHYFEKKGITYTVTDQRSCPVVWDGSVIKTLKDGPRKTITLRPDQRAVVRLALKAGRGVVKSATGSGKTEDMASIVASLGIPKTLVVVPNLNLLGETAARLAKRLGIKVGKVGGGDFDVKQVTVAVPASFMSKKHIVLISNLLASVQLMLIDEAQHSASKTWVRALGLCANAYYRFGFSATPLDRSDGSNMQLIALTGPIVATVKSSTLVDQGILAKPYVKIVEIAKPFIPSCLKYDEVYKLGIVKNKVFHDQVAKTVRQELAENRAVLVLVTQIAHGEYLASRLPGVKFVHAGTPKEAIKQAKAELANGTAKALIASPIFREGMDIPAIDTMVVADGGKSVIRVIQKAGRAMRRKTDKPNICRIIDFAHLTHPYLAGHALQRIEVYRREGFTFLEED